MNTLQAIEDKAEAFEDKPCEHHTPESMIGMLSEFTSTGSKVPWHKDIIDGLHEGRGVPKVSGIFITDTCQHKCAFCSTANRAKDFLSIHQITTYIDQLIPLGLKAVILSGGGNPILWKDKNTGDDFNDLVTLLNEKGLQIGLITNGLKNMVK